MASACLGQMASTSLRSRGPAVPTKLEVVRGLPSSSSLSFASPGRQSCEPFRSIFQAQWQDDNMVSRRPRVVRGSLGHETKVDSGEEKAESSSPASSSGSSTVNGSTPSSSGIPSPFSSGKISSKIAAKTVSSESKPPGPVYSPAKPPVFTTVPKPSSPFNTTSMQEKGATGAFPTGKVSPFAADRLKSVAMPPNAYNRATSGQALIGSGKKVLEAFKQGEKEGRTTKFGQPLVPLNIFVDAKRTPEEIAADAFQFKLSPSDIFLLLSFSLITGLMLGTVFLVWKLGAIHYNE